MSFDLVIKNGTIVTAESTYRADIGIQGEAIVAIGEGLTGTKEVDASEKLVIPGAVDIHVHMQMPIGDFVSSDDFFSGTRAAALGGTTAIVDFVEPIADETLVDALVDRRALADPKVVIDYGLHMTIGPGEIDKLDQVPAAYEEGCGSFKLYMAYGLRLDDGHMLRALEAIRDVNGLPVIHAENWDVICMLVARNLAAGNVSPHWHPRSRPAQFEGEAVGRVVELAEYVGTRAHIFHVTCNEAVQQIAADEGAAAVAVCAEIEMEMVELDDEERQEFLDDLGLDEPGLNRVIRAGYKLLGLQTYFTAGVKEVRAWTVPVGATAPQAAGVIHTDFERGFIRAEITAFDDFIACNGEQGAKEAGKLRLEGKDYIVQDGDVVHFRFNV